MTNTRNKFFKIPSKNSSIRHLRPSRTLNSPLILSTVSWDNLLYSYLTRRLDNFSKSIYLCTLLIVSVSSALVVETLNANYLITSFIFPSAFVSHFLWVPVFLQLFCLLVSSNIFSRFLCFVFSFYSTLVPIKILISEFYKKDIVLSNSFITIRRLWTVSDFREEAQLFFLRHNLRVSASEISDCISGVYNMRELNLKVNQLLFVKLNPSFFEKTCEYFYANGPGLVVQITLGAFAMYSIKILVTAFVSGSSSLLGSLFSPLTSYWYGAAANPSQSEHQDLVNTVNNNMQLTHALIADGHTAISLNMRRLSKLSSTKLDDNSKTINDIKTDIFDVKVALRHLVDAVFFGEFDENSTDLDEPLIPSPISSKS